MFLFSFCPRLIWRVFLLWIQMSLLMRRYHRVLRLLPPILPNPANSPRSVPQQLLSIISDYTERLLMIPDLKGWYFFPTSAHFSNLMLHVYFILVKFDCTYIFCWKDSILWCVHKKPFSWLWNIYFIPYIFAHITRLWILGVLDFPHESTLLFYLLFFDYKSEKINNETFWYDWQKNIFMIIYSESATLYETIVRW